MPEGLFRTDAPALSVNDYAAIGPADGGMPAGRLIPGGMGLMTPSFLNVKGIAAAYTVDDGDSGSVLIVTAAVTVTLPAASAALKGMHFWGIVGADVSVVFAAAAGTLVVFNNVAATSIAFSTSGEKTGNSVHFVCDGAKWYAMVGLAAETATPTIA